MKPYNQRRDNQKNLGLILKKEIHRMTIRQENDNRPIFAWSLLEIW